MRPIDILNLMAEMENSDFGTMSAEKQKVRVSAAKGALRWVWKTDNPNFAFPCTVASATVDVVDGAIDQADLGDGTMCSLFTADPRPAGNSARPLGLVTSDLGVHPRSSEGANLTSCFAFFRGAVPSFDYEEEFNAETSYLLPSNIPEVFLDIVATRALTRLLVGLKQWESLNAIKASYDDPKEQKEALMASLIDSRMVWHGKMVTINAAPGAGAVVPWMTVFNGYVRVRQPNGEFMFLQGFGAPP